MKGNQTFLMAVERGQANVKRWHCWGIGCEVSVDELELATAEKP